MVETTEQITNYILERLTNNTKKKVAYEKHVRSGLMRPYEAIKNMEESREYQQIYDKLVNQHGDKTEAIVARAQKKFALLVEKNIDTMAKVLEEAEEEDIKSKAVAVRLANETLTAMSFVATSPVEESKRKKIDVSSVII